MSYHDWKPGDKIICINEGVFISYKFIGVIVPIKGEIYTIKNITRTTYPCDDISVLLKEITNPSIVWNDGKMGIPWYPASLFRKLLDQGSSQKDKLTRGTDTGFDVLKKILDDIKVPELEKV